MYTRDIRGRNTLRYSWFRGTCHLSRMQASRAAGLCGKWLPSAAGARGDAKGNTARAIFDVIEAGARVINLSLALLQESAYGEAELGRALDHSAGKGIIVVVAAGNQGTVGSSVITRHRWVVPVVAYDLHRHLMALSNLGEQSEGAASEHRAKG